MSCHFSQKNVPHRGDFRIYLIDARAYAIEHHATYSILLEPAIRDLESLIIPMKVFMVFEVAQMMLPRIKKQPP